MLAMLDALSNVDLLSFDIILQPLAHDQCVFWMSLLMQFNHYDLECHFVCG